MYLCISPYNYLTKLQPAASPKIPVHLLATLQKGTLVAKTYRGNDSQWCRYEEIAVGCGAADFSGMSRFVMQVGEQRELSSGCLACLFI